MDLDRYPHIAEIEHPRDIQGYDPPQLTALAEECREFLIESIGQTGGHLGAALGVVELTVALFNQFDFLSDRIAWDVGHQAHVHKVLTGRGPQFDQYGLWGGLCKFLERTDSPYDHMGAGHASTSVSAALGMALARDRMGQSHAVISVIGDGAMTGGLAYEALHLAGSLDLNLIVIYNDNGMSIDRNVGGFTRTVTRITSSEAYGHLREELKRVSGHMPFGSEILKSFKHMERSLKDYFSPDVAAFFESLGFHYFGPVPGHDLKDLISMLSHAKSMRGPILIHVHTVKGKGLGPELENTFAAHAVSPKKSKAKPVKAKPVKATKSWTQVFSEGIADLVAKDPKVMAITAAMSSNTGLEPLKERFPEQVLDVGIAEANGFCSAAGMAVGGLKPFVTIYSTFAQRAFDQLIHDIGVQQLPVRIMMDRGGFVGADGPTHHGVFDLSYLRLIPGLVHMAPMNELEMRRMMLTAYFHESGPIAMRYPRGDTEAMSWEGALEPIPVGEGELLIERPGAELVLIAVGSMVSRALAAAEALAGQGVFCNVVNARFVKPLDERLLLEQIERARGVVTLEENVLAGGFGEAVLRIMADGELERPTRLLGAPDRFVGFGSQQDQLRDAGLLPEQIEETALDLWSRIMGKRPQPQRRPA
ncbi:MAG: 1-deoxy-D-xylulose-5-phosphate synthase [SAR324 cluster bacterium]|nr:1-deoxy-D-xylulose-5-phosphate synthase [SAR324 cluster bacterium]